eukprot:CAMPEP_0113495658 /NCGR_PEP_ID=MMETSP0014_2-20120614/29722_1 /TAXON_ID=2857 /ORGANISM="Nitzschia sp." /LENGTH=703 /DNA_ID=CAMNT_0000389561 /DNA_START=116 /DNA_END=2224 /DNA_ORIENTATION=+ /assembly_acc=CAM_ASM_000159
MVAEEISPRMRRRVSSSQSTADESFFSGPSYEIPLAGEDEVEHSNTSSRSRSRSNSNSNHNSSTSTRKSPPNDKSIRFSLHSANGLSSHLEEEEEADFNDDEFASDEGDYNSDSSNEFETTLLPPSSPGTGSVSPDDTIPTQYASSDSDSLGGGGLGGGVGGGVGGDGRLRGISRSKSASASLSANPQSPTFSESKQRTLIKNNSSPRNSKISRIVSHNNRHKGNYYRDPGQVGSPGPIVTPRLVKIPSPRQQERKKTSSLLSHSDHSLDSIDCSYGDASIHGFDDCWRNNSNGSLSSPSSSSKPIFTVVSPNDGCGRSATIPIGGGRKVSISSIAVMAFCMLGLALYSNARTSLRYALTEVNELVDFSDKLHHQLTKADRDMRMLQRELAALDSIEQRREDDAVEERVLSQSSAFANPKLVEEMTNIQDKLKSSSATVIPGEGSVSPDDTIPTQYASSDSDSLGGGGLGGGVGGGVGGDGRLRGISRSKSASASLSANPQSPTFSESKQRTLIKNNSSPRNSNNSRIVSNNHHKGIYYRDPGQVGSPGAIVTPRLVKILSPRQQDRKKASSLLSQSDHSLDSIDCSYGDASIHGIDDCWRNNSNGSLSSPSSSSKPIFTVVSPNDVCGSSATVPIGGGRKVSISSIAVMAFCMLGLALYSNARTSLRYALTEVNDLVDFSDKLHHQLTKADRDMRMLQRELA